MEEVLRGLKKEIMAVCMSAQDRLGGDNAAVLYVMNALMHATAEYAVGATTADREEAQRRFNDLSMRISKVMQDYLAEHTGGAVIVELPEGP